jgi:hypothetical protein
VSRIAGNALRLSPTNQRQDRHSPLGVFFMLCLSGRICSRNQRSGFN